MRTRLAISGAAATALALVGLLATGPATAGAATAAAATPAEVTVIPPDPAQTTVPDNIVFAGTTGFLHQYNGSAGYLWTTYSTGTSTPVTALNGVSIGLIRPAGGDDVDVYGTSLGGPGMLLDLATMTSAAYKAPSGATVEGVYGTSMLVSELISGIRTLAVISLATGTTAPVTPPAGVTYFRTPAMPGDASAAVVGLESGGLLTGTGLLDLATASVTPLPGSLGSTQMLLSADSVGVYDPASRQVQVYSRSGVTLGTNTTSQSITLPAPAAGGYDIALAGQYVMAVPTTAPASGPAAAIAAPLSGSPATTALTNAATGPDAIAQAPDGVVVIGGSGAPDWSVHEFATAAGGSLGDTAVLPLTGPLTNAGLTISQGEVRHLEAGPAVGGQPQYLMFNHSLLPDNGFSQFSADPQLYGGVLSHPIPCAAGTSCVRSVDSNGYGTSYLKQQTATSIDLYEQTAANSSTMSLTLPSASGTLVDASPFYAIVDGTGPATQYVVDVGQENVLSTGPVTGAALWFSTLWRSDGPSKVQATNLENGDAAPQTISTGSGCTATELQATERWLYWSCGTSGPAGVYDLQTKTDIPVPAGPALLGDGFVVQHDQSTGDLVMYDVHADTASSPITLATGVASTGATDDRNITWAVDKYSGDVAYVTADDSVHVVDTGVPTAPPAIGDPVLAGLQGTSFIAPSSSPSWGPSVFLSRPVTSWQVTIRQAGTGEVVATSSGGPAKVGFRPAWNGLLASGAAAYSGRYTWSATLTTANSATSATVAGGPLVVDCGQIPFRSYDCDGAPALLKVTRNTDAEWYQGTAAGRLTTLGYTENWPLCSDTGGTCVTAIVPFGDFNGDGFADLLVRYRNGVLRAYLGFGQAYFNTQVVKSIRISAGWNQYNALAAPGSLTNGGKPYLVARDTSGRLWSYATAGHGKFAARKLISRGWNQYTRLIGAGDLNGDGIGDLLAVDSRGRMWLYYGNGHGSFGARHLVSSGWNAYNAIIGVGDLNGKGNNDLVARGTKGALWLFAGSGHGSFGKPVNLKLNLGRDSLF